jgi:phosphoserine phosphatase
MARVRWPLVTVDIDGTLTRGHGWETISDRLGRRAEFDRTNRRYLDREIGEDAHLADLLRIAQGARRAEVEDALASTPRVRGIRAGVEALHGAGRRVALLTHNPGYVCAWYQARFGFDDFEGNRTQHVTRGRIGPPGRVHAGKLPGVRRLAQRAGVGLSEVVHVGDSWVDAEVFPRVGRGIALNTSSPEVRAAADVSMRTDDFRAVVRRIDRLAPRS